MVLLIYYTLVILNIEICKKFWRYINCYITADKYVKGPNRPYFNQVNRAEMLSTLDFIDKVSIVNSFSAIPAIENIKPNYYIKGIEYKNENNDLTKN